MTRKQHISLIAGLILAAFVAGSPAQADSYKKKRNDQAFPSLSQSFLPSERTTKPQWAQRKISASEAKSIALRKVPGAEVVDIVLQGSVYRVRLIRRDGRVVDVLVDAATGRVR